ncbi:hypothetical protein B0H14DRAFT_3732823 [Mycena olivaceomarginata]|nr:hypothetical protein B0H14DRAFT_3732823 [Mycena olivaceomarginata]
MDQSGGARPQHDDDWRDIFGEGNPAQTMSDLLQRIGDEYVIVEKGGATFLQAMSASSRNESHELSGPSGNRSRTTSSTVHTSLPAVDHGVTFNPLHHYSAHNTWSMRRQREREGSLATLRQQSRSLEDQVSVGDNNTVHAPNVLSMTISIPESDSDSRSLSVQVPAQRESPTSINTPPVFTVPTLAPPAPAVNPSPQSNDHGNVSSGGGFDGSGLDLDWSAMHSGITDLDMSKVAIR